MKTSRFLLALAFIAGAILTASCQENGREKNVETNTMPLAVETAPPVPGKPKVTFIEIGSVNCIPCKAMQPIMRDIEKEYPGQVKVVFYDVWTVEQAEYGEKYGIRAIPTQVFLDKDGKEYFRHEGYFPKSELVKVLKLRGME
ncbi:MAG: thioredoxin family protein [Spirochaetales bacterium]|nr:thioredoxin family protein [Spirochaetales bacterium]